MLSEALRAGGGGGGGGGDSAHGGFCDVSGGESVQVRPWRAPASAAASDGLGAKCSRANKASQAKSSDCDDATSCVKHSSALCKSS